MELTSAVNPSARYHVVHPFFFDENIVGVLEGKYVLGSVARRGLVAVRTERRTSFKHPVVGAALGLVMTVIPLQSVAGDPLGLWWLTLGSPFRLVGSFFMFWFGAYLLWGVGRRRDQPWVVFVTGSGETAFPLEHELSPDAAAVLRALCGGTETAGT